MLAVHSHSRLQFFQSRTRMLWYHPTCDKQLQRMAMLRGQVVCVVALLGLLLVGHHVQGMKLSAAEEVMGYDPRRSLGGAPYYISYGTLNANRAPCPSGQGRSYYTQSCQPTGGDAQPYVRSCTQIARCARG